ncbi:selenium metabolism-associated LysR family transcriptional regulator [Desulfoplanes formicivorans]|uniref:LysR family transcriptional regulator n=1 Tax=Desulfoplanes formicivorans TaxID=1592317 RepID=A0A194AFG2_9BACT|nr:selenium metabolism-associated LysR family transcriptional regulator [Desulfoplanes formicivorans]GAU07519.1 LysR family transcriptional regulator [Desulfoplanes formicivorans]
MDIRRLEAFAKVYETRSFSKAGKKLFLSQPTISSHVALLEDELGILLFDRVGRNVLPTQAAEILYGRTRSIFHVLDMARAEIDLLRQTISGPIILGGSTIPADYILPPMLAKFMRTYPEVQIDLRVGDTGGVIDMVRQGEVMLAMVGSAADCNDLAFVPLLEDDLVLIGTEKLIHAVSQGDAHTTLCSVPWVMREPGSGTRRALESALKSVDLGVDDLRVGIQVQNTQAMLGCVLAGMGISVTSRMVVDPYVKRGEMGVASIPGFTMSRTFYLVYNQKRELFPATRALRDFLVNDLSLSQLSAS